MGKQESRMIYELRMCGHKIQFGNAMFLEYLSVLHSRWKGMVFGTQNFLCQKLTHQNEIVPQYGKLQI